MPLGAEIEFPIAPIGTIGTGVSSPISVCRRCNQSPILTSADLRIDVPIFPLSPDTLSSRARAGSEPSAGFQIGNGGVIAGRVLGGERSGATKVARINGLLGGAGYDPPRQHPRINIDLGKCGLAKATASHGGGIPIKKRNRRYRCPLRDRVGRGLALAVAAPVEMFEYHRESDSYSWQLAKPRQVETRRICLCGRYLLSVVLESLGRCLIKSQCDSVAEIVPALFQLRETD